MTNTGSNRPCHAVTTFSTASRAHLRRAGPDGQAVKQRGPGASNRGERAAGVTRRKRLRFNRGTRRCRAARVARVLRTIALRTRRRAAHGTPGDRPPAVPAVSRCRARQHHSQTAIIAPGAPIAWKCHSHGVGTPRIVRVGPSSVKGTRRSFLTASQKRSSGPALEHWRPLPTQRA